MDLPSPVIVLPGITGNNLRDEYPLPPNLPWTVLEKDYERLALHPENLLYESAEPSRIVPDQLFDIAYKELISELRYNLQTRADQPVPVYAFGYDWRKPLEYDVLQLKEFVQEVIERTSLLRHYRDAGFTSDEGKVNLVGHSMGGLIITGYLKQAGLNSRVDKVVTLGTPFRGSFEAVIKVTTGTANLGLTAPSSRERDLARLTPALYYLLPMLVDGFLLEPGVRSPFSLFDPTVWQPSVADSIKTFLDSQGFAAPTPEAVFSSMLDHARAYREQVASFQLAEAGLSRDRWLAIAGVNVDTRVRLHVVQRQDKPDFDLRSADRMNDCPDPTRLTGDGTVPFESAVPPFLGLENLVCVIPDDFGYWEVVPDRLLMAAGAADLHSLLPAMDMLHRLIVRFLAGRADPHFNTWGRRAPGLAAWEPPMSLQPLQEKPYPPRK